MREDINERTYRGHKSEGMCSSWYPSHTEQMLLLVSLQSYGPTLEKINPVLVFFNPEHAQTFSAGKINVSKYVAKCK